MHCIQLHIWALQPAYSTQEPSYSLHSPDISQVVTCLLQREPNFNCLHSLDQTASILQTIAKSQRASSRWESNYSLHSLYPLTLNRSQLSCGRKKPIPTTYTSSRQEPNHSMHSLNRNPATAYILAKLLKPCIFWHEPSHRLHFPDSSTCILQMRANVQPAFSRHKPN